MDQQRPTAVVVDDSIVIVDPVIAVRTDAILRGTGGRQDEGSGGCFNGGTVASGNQRLIAAQSGNGCRSTRRIRRRKDRVDRVPKMSSRTWLTVGFRTYPVWCTLVLGTGTDIQGKLYNGKKKNQCFGSITISF